MNIRVATIDPKRDHDLATQFSGTMPLWREANGNAGSGRRSPPSSVSLHLPRSWRSSLRCAYSDALPASAALHLGSGAAIPEQIEADRQSPRRQLTQRKPRRALRWLALLPDMCSKKLEEARGQTIQIHAWICVVRASLRHHRARVRKASNSRRQRALRWRANHDRPSATFAASFAKAWNECGRGHIANMGPVLPSKATMRFQSKT